MKRSVVVAGACLGLLLLGADIAEGAGRQTKRKLPPDQALKRKIDHHTAKGSLMAVLTDFASQAGVTIRVDWKALEKTGVTGSRRQPGERHLPAGPGGHSVEGRAKRAPAGLADRLGRRRHLHAPPHPADGRGRPPPDREPDDEEDGRQPGGNR